MDVSSLSIEIINYIYFEYFLDEKIANFKNRFNELIDDYIDSALHQLLDLENDFTFIDKSMKHHKTHKNDYENIDGINYSKLYDLIETKRKDVKEFIELKFKSIRANSKNKDYSKESRNEILSNLIDGEKNLKLFYKFEEWLVKNNYLDKDSYKWIDSAGKSSFMRFYLKCENEIDDGKRKKITLLKQNKKRSKRIRLLSDLYKIDKVAKSDYSLQRCEDAYKKNKEEFKELDSIYYQHNLNS